MRLACTQCRHQLTLDDRLADRTTIVLCPECGWRCKVEGPLEPASFTVTRRSGATLSAADVAEVQALLATGVLAPSDTIEAPGMPPVAVDELEGFEPFFGPPSDRDRWTPPYGSAAASGASPASRSDRPSSARMSMGGAPPVPRTLRPIPASVATPDDEPPVSEAPPPPLAVDAIARPSVPSIRATATSTQPDPTSSPPPRADDPRPGRRWLGPAARIAVPGALAVLAIVIAHELRDARDRERADELVRTGEAALASGQLDLAKERFDQASALRPVSGRLLVGAARVAIEQADDAWLRRRMIADGDEDERRRLDQSLAELSARADRLANMALAAMPKDGAAVALAADALRLDGNLERARSLAAGLPQTSSDPETDYVRAMLVVAGDGPITDEAVAALERAAERSFHPARARSALVYAHARRSERARALAEHDRLTRLTQPAPLAGALRAFIDRAAPAVPVAAVASVPAPVPPPLPEKKVEPRPVTPREILRQADIDLRAGKLDRAHRSYARVLDMSRGQETDARIGLARVARARGDLEAARQELEGAVANDPRSLRGRAALADLEWEVGDRAIARQLYRQILVDFADRDLPAGFRGRAEPPSTLPDPH